MRAGPVSMRRTRLIASLVALCAAAAQAQSPSAVASFADGPPNGAYAFASWTPKTMPELMKGDRGTDPVNVVGHLFLPPGEGKAPALVFVHGSGGVYKAMLDYWPKQFNAAGYAVLSLDLFGPRGATGVELDNSKVPFAADVADVYSALRVLATHPRIDPQRIALMGVSRGGTATLRAALQRVAASQGLPEGLRYAAFVPTYAGGCAGVFRVVVKPGVFSKSPMLFVHGDADDYTPISACQDYAERIGKAGTPVEFLALDGVHHKFDDDNPKRYYNGAVQRTLPDCPVEIDVDTMSAFHRSTGAKLQGAAYTDALKSCGARGATVEGNPRARDKAAQAVIGFLNKSFGR